jgi:hypothetical protein
MEKPIQYTGYTAHRMTSIAAMSAMSSNGGTTLGKNSLSQEASAPFSSFARGADFGTAKFDNERTPFGMKVIGKDNRKRPDMGTYFSESARPDNAFGRQSLSNKESPGVYSFYRGDSLDSTKEKEMQIQRTIDAVTEKCGKNVGTYLGSSGSCASVIRNLHIV